MGTQRTSMKDVLEAIQLQTSAINTLTQAIAHTPETVVPAGVLDLTPVCDPAPKAKPAEFTMDADLQRQFKRYCVRWDKLAADKGERVVGYAYRNKQGQTKLWGCVESKLDSIQARDSFIGNVYATS